MKTVALILLICVAYANCDCKSQGSACPSSQTCCDVVGGVGCCPYKAATCCADKLHCCPSGYQCDVTAGTCAKSSNNEFLAFLGLMETVKPVEITQENEMKDVVSCIIEHFPELQADIDRIVKDAKTLNINDLKEALPKLIKDGQNIIDICKQ